VTRRTKNAKAAKAAKTDMFICAVSRMLAADATLLAFDAHMADEDEKESLNLLSNLVIGAALRVHDELGPGMLESAYEACLSYDLLDQGLAVERQQPVPVIYRGRRLDCGYRIDVLVEERLIVEVKAIERLEKVHYAQLRSQLRFSKMKLGLLINFNVRSLREGLKRIVNGFPD
jgi:GxxExxY protein